MSFLSNFSALGLPVTSVVALEEAGIEDVAKYGHGGVALDLCLALRCGSYGAATKKASWWNHEAYEVQVSVLILDFFSQAKPDYLEGCPEV